MSKTFDHLFYKEFKDMMNGRKSLAGNYNLNELPIPELPSMTHGTPKRKMALVRGIKEPFFERLNKEEVELVGRTSLQKRQVLSDGTFRKDKDGKYVTEQVPVQHDSVAILSKVSIGLKRYIEIDGVKKEHRVTEGYRYVDYIESNGVRKYIYIVPKQYVYRLNLCALILTPNKRRIFFRGCRLALQNGSYVYLYVVPYTYRDNMDVRVLGVKASYNFDEEVMTILRYWISLGVIFDLNLTVLENQVSGITNAGITDLEGTVVSEDYNRVGVSLAEEKEDLLED